MKHLFITLSLFALVACSSANKAETPVAATPAAPQFDHAVHMEHQHEHGKTCGHKPVTHDNHMDVMHDGHFHSGHMGHMDDHGQENSVGTMATDHAMANAHDHKHDKKCGHKAVKHGTHMDFIHDGHYHSSHEMHFDEHGMVVTM